MTPEQLASDVCAFHAFTQNFTSNPFAAAITVAPDVTQTGTGFLKVRFMFEETLRVVTLLA